MPDENEQIRKTEPQNPPPDELDNKPTGVETTGSKKRALSSKLEIFKHLFPALKEAFAAGTKTFKRRIQGITEPEQSGEEEEQPQNALPSVDNTKVNETHDDSAEKSLPQQQAGFFKSKLAAFSKKQKILLGFFIASIVIIPVWFGLYLGGMFDEQKDTAAESSKSVAAAPQEDSRKGNFFDSIFGKKSQHSGTPKEQLAAMHITYNPTNFVKYAGQNNMPVVKLFIQSGMNPDTRRPLDGFTPLTAAAAFDRPEMAKFLLDDNGADINAQDNDGQTALMKAVRHNRSQIVEILLERNADYNITDKQGNTALSLAKEPNADNSMIILFEKFGIDISTVKKEPIPEKKPAFVPPLLPNKAPVLPNKSSDQTKKSQYTEISVQEFLKLIEAEPTPAQTSNQ